MRTIVDKLFKGFHNEIIYSVHCFFTLYTMQHTISTHNMLGTQSRDAEQGRRDAESQGRLTLFISPVPSSGPKMA